MMTKVISLSNDAYTELKKRKGKGESFSDVVMRMTRGRQTGSLLEFKGAWVGGDLDKVEKILERDREASRGRRGIDL